MAYRVYQGARSSLLDHMGDVIMVRERCVPSEDPWPAGGTDADTATLVDEALRGSQPAWDQLVDRFLPLVASLMRRYRITGADADDVNQTVWLRLVEHLHRIDDAKALPGWIATVTRHECFRVQQQRGRSVPTDPQATATFDRPESAADLLEELLVAERHTALMDGLLELPAQRRELLLLLTEDPPLTYAEISRRCGIPVGSIGPTRARALQQLRRTRAFRRLTSTHPDGSHR
jgi:RNA polymerase sigma factor (sigma-70 family)